MLFESFGQKETVHKSFFATQIKLVPLYVFCAACCAFCDVIISTNDAVKMDIMVFSLEVMLS